MADADPSECKFYEMSTAGDAGLIGKKLSDRYELRAELGRGGMGVVYRAHDPMLNREVAIKLIPPTMMTPDAEQRFQREAQVVAQMDHPAIVSIYDLGRHEGLLFFVMPVVQGTTLRTVLRKRSLNLGDVIDIGIQVADALAYSHSRGVVHRDIKPENIMLVPGSAVAVKVMDFGLARLAHDARMTKTGMLVGTMAYFSPEQVGRTDVDARSDIYALGTVLYECVVGKAPFLGEMQSILYRIVHENPESPRTAGAEIDEDLERIILSCLAKDVEKRTQTAAELAESLRRYRARLRDSDRLKSIAGSRAAESHFPALSPFIGREKEVAELQQRLNAALRGECQFAVVSGEPGIGKTRLIDELGNLAQVRHLRVLHGRFVEQDRSFPYQGFCEVIQEFFRGKESGSSSAPMPDFSDLAADLVSVFPMLSEIEAFRVASTGESKPAPAADPRRIENRTYTFELLARTLIRMAAGKPLVLLLEELHGAEISIEALQYIVRRLGPTPTLIVGTWRSTEVDRRHPLSAMLAAFHSDKRFTSMTLGPLSRSEHRLFLQTLVGGQDLSNELLDRLYGGTEGNPFFTKELVRSLLDSGAIERGPTGAWMISGEAGISIDTLPATIQQAVKDRIGRLPDDLKEILSTASIIGKTFDFKDLEMLAEGKGDVEDAVDRLAQEGLIEEERESRGDRLAFSSGVVRDVLYSELSPRKRRSLHRKYAEYLERRHGGRAERVLPQLVYHFSQGDVADKTVEYGLRLASRSLEAFSAEEAARSARSAIEFLDEEWEGDRSLEGDARMLLARAQRMTGDVDGALKEVDAAVRIYEEEKQPAKAVRALLLAAETAWQGRRVEAAGRWLTRGLTAARAAAEPESLREILSFAATLANLRGEYDKANEYLAEVEAFGPRVAEAVAEEKIPRGGGLVVGFRNAVSTIDPTAAKLAEEVEVLTSIAETLFATDTQGALVPALCERYDVEENGKTFLLSLRHDVRFQDGHVLTAADVKTSFEHSARRMKQALPGAYAAVRGAAEFVAGSASEITGIVVRSDHQFEIRLIESLPLYPALLTDYHAAIVRVAEARGDFPTFIGTGPFRMAAHERDRVVLERSTTYRKNDGPYLDGIEFRSGMSAGAMASGLRSGELDLVRDLSPEDLDEFLRDPRFRGGLVEVPSKNTYFVLFNCDSGPLAKNLEVRRALSGVVSTVDLVWRTLGRFAEPAACLIPPGILGHDPGTRHRTLPRAQVVEALRAAGVGSPIRLRAAVHPLLQDRYAALLKALFATWSDVGVLVSVETPDMTSFLESGQKSEGLDMRIGRWLPDYSDPDSFTHGLFHSRVGVMSNYFSAPDADRMLEEARAEMRADARVALYRRFEARLLESAVLIPLFHDIDYRLASPKVRGLKLKSSPPFVDYAEVGKVQTGAPVVEPRRTGGVLHIPIGGVVASLDPLRSLLIEATETLSCAYETLTRLGDGARIVPWLCSEFAAEDGGRRYRFHLREDVRFHDGRRLTARDVRYSYERYLGYQGSDFRWNLSAIRGAKALIHGEAGDLAGFRIHSAHEFTIELEEPVSFFPALLSHLATSVVAEGSSSFEENWQKGAVGTGPYRIVKFEPGRVLEFERHPNYWRRDYPKTDRVVFSFGLKPEHILAEFKAGRLSLASDLYPEDIEALRHDPVFAARYRETPRLSTHFIAFNTRRGPLVEKRLRQMLVSAIDVPTLVSRTLGRLATPASRLMPPGLLGQDSAYGARGASRPASAAEPGIDTELTCGVNAAYLGEYSPLLTGLTNVLREKGVRLRRVTENMEQFLDVQKRASVDVLIGRWIGDYPDADTFIHGILHSQAGCLGRFFESPEIDRICMRARGEPDQAARRAFYQEIEDLIARDALLLPTFHDTTYRFARPEIEGLAVSFLSPIVAYENLRIVG